jgi:uncharacterized protein
VTQFTREQVRDVVCRTQAIYAKLAARPIERQCVGRAECCHFRLTGKTPHLTRGEAFTAWSAVKASGRKALPESIDGACPLLNPKTQRCLIYTGRPFGCRTHFCQPAGGPLARQEVIDLIRELETIDAECGGDGSKPLPSALREIAEI